MWGYGNRKHQATAVVMCVLYVSCVYSRTCCLGCQRSLKLSLLRWSSQPCTFFLKKEILSDVQQNNSGTLDFKHHANDFDATFLLKKEKEAHATLFLLNCMTSAVQVIKKGIKHAYWRAASMHKALLLCIFMQMRVPLIQRRLSRSASRCPGSVSQTRCVQMKFDEILCQIYKSIGTYK